MSTGNIQSLFDDAQQEGLSSSAAGILVNNLNAATIAGAQGAAADELAGDEATLYVRVIDRTGSMSSFTDTVIDAANQQIGALRDSKSGESILMSTWFFNTKSDLLHSYVSLANAVPLDTVNYAPSGFTALYDATLDAITSAVAYAQSLINAGIRIKVVIIIVSDGEDNSSSASVAKVRTVIEDLLKQEIYTVSFVAFGSHGRQVAVEMGIPVGNLLNEKEDDHSIRLAFGEMSASVIRTSQTSIGQNSQSFFS